MQNKNQGQSMWRKHSYSVVNDCRLDDGANNRILMDAGQWTLPKPCTIKIGCMGENEVQRAGARH